MNDLDPSQYQECALLKNIVHFRNLLIIYKLGKYCFVIPSRACCTCCSLVFESTNNLYNVTKSLYGFEAVSSLQPLVHP